MTLVLSEGDVQGLVEMKEVVTAVEEAFSRQASSNAVNSPRTRSAVPGSSLNVMHASLPYLGRAGVKSYITSKAGSRFVFILFDLTDGTPLAVMGADVLGRNRTGAASAVATKHLFLQKDLSLAVFGSGWQALTQVLALGVVASIREVKIWSPTPTHVEKFAVELRGHGLRARASASPRQALAGTEVASAITSSKDGFIDGADISSVRHLNLCGSNSPRRAEALPSAVSRFQTFVVDDLVQAKYEAGDLIQAEAAGVFEWHRATELKDVVSRKAKPEGRTLFKSHGAAIEDVAAASLIYDKALKAGGFPEVDLG
ncbi:MAG: ornithine cyclodeaminase family protein [Thaumarchaeota archaeon]|nr:ornithine cyclodeaminase family protein [Nitrososphaerota archaeon]